MQQPTMRGRKDRWDEDALDLGDERLDALEVGVETAEDGHGEGRINMDGELLGHLRQLPIEANKVGEADDLEKIVSSVEKRGRGRCLVEDVVVEHVHLRHKVPARLGGWLPAAHQGRHWRG